VALTQAWADTAPGTEAIPETPAQRVHGALRLSFVACASGHSTLGRLFQRAPCRVLFPRVEAGDPVQAVLLTTSGGLTGGDQLDIALSVEPGAAACFATQAAEKLYRAEPDAPATVIRIDLQVAGGAWAEWLAQETILFDQSRLHRTTEITLSGDARCLAVESLVLGRQAMGETYSSGTLHDAWRIRRDGELIWADAWHWDDPAEARGRAFALGAYQALATLLYAGRDAGDLLDAVRAELDVLDVEGGAGVHNDILIIRLLATDATQLRRAVKQLAAHLRAQAGGCCNRMPQVWLC